MAQLEKQLVETAVVLCIVCAVAAPVSLSLFLLLQFVEQVPGTLN